MNFCQESLGTTITVLNQVESEGHEAKTLLQNQGQGSIRMLSKSGFLSESFCRPPVTLRLEFSLPIEISHIVIGPKVGQQVSNAFVLRTETGRPPQRPRYHPEIPQNHNSADSDLKHEIGKEYINDLPVPNILVFRNPRFVLRPQFCDLRLGQFECHRNYPGSFQLKHPSYDSCEKVVALEVTIQRVVGFCVPAIGMLAVWGQPAQNASKEQILNVLNSGSCQRNRLKRGAEAEATMEELLDDEPTIKRAKTHSNSQSECSVVVPEEFLDPISFEIMLKPIRLPCGIAIDSNTLERYSKEEAIWGRVENDPFTGVCFTDALRPIPDSGLKSRIDAFLTKNSNETSFKNLPRILGTGNEPNGFGSSRISHLRSLYQNKNLANSSSGEAPNSTCSTRSNSSTSAVDSVSEAEDSNHSHGISAQSFMDQEMARILGSTTYKSKKTDENTTGSQCLTCFTIVNSSTPGASFYSSSCKHIVLCRTCLLRTDKTCKNVCGKCGQVWVVNELTRIFT